MYCLLYYVHLVLLVFLVELVSQHISELTFTPQGFDEVLRAREGGETPQIQGNEILHLSLRASSRLLGCVTPRKT